MSSTSSTTGRPAGGVGDQVDARVQERRRDARHQGGEGVDHRLRDRPLLRRRGRRPHAPAAAAHFTDAARIRLLS